MKLTQEQQDILQSEGNIKINAVAGSGKTTTVIEYAKTRPKNSRILYLAFNKTVKQEAQQKFRKHHLNNVRVETAHSLAYASVVRRNGYQLSQYGYKPHELTSLLGIKARNDEKHMEYIVANHVLKFASYYCNSNKATLDDLDYRRVVFDAKAKAFVNTFYDYIEDKTRLFIQKMEDAQIEITHDFYLKQYQLSQPQLRYDYILFDEGQDASPAMLDVFEQQKAIKVIVGDTHQQIYSWRYAINSLGKLDYQLYHLSNSFRFSQNIAALATAVLDWKLILAPHVSPKIWGKGDHQQNTSKATLARTNLGLLLRAIETIADGEITKIHFEGNIHSYTYADDGASLYDVLNLHTDQKHRIRDKLIQKMKDLKDLEDYIEKTEDIQLAMMVNIVKEYGKEIPGLIQTLKDMHVEKEEAEMIFSTVHKSKGMEYDSVTLVSDFITEERLIKQKKEKEYTKLNEEINLLYVAITRTKNELNIPFALLPEGFEASGNINLIELPEEEEEEPKQERHDNIQTPTLEKAYSVAEFRKEHASAYAPWDETLDDELTVMFLEGKTVKEMALTFGRTPGAIRSRVKKLELREKYLD